MLCGMNLKASAASTAMTKRNSPIRRRRERLRAAPAPARTKSHVSLEGKSVGMNDVILWYPILVTYGKRSKNGHAHHPARNPPTSTVGRAHEIAPRRSQFLSAYMTTSTTRPTPANNAGSMWDMKSRQNTNAAHAL